MIAPVGAAILVVLSVPRALRYFGCYGRGSGMRHFLIITCLAALTCATAPVQVALAQADSPIVESEVEPSPEPSEETPGESTPSEEGGPKAEQNDKEQKESGVSLSLSDPLTIARFVVTPILLWILKNLVSYSFRRMHIARTIYVDVEYQLRFLNRAVEELEKWFGGLRQWPPVVGYLRLSPDRHYVYPSIQTEILECMWGEEITAVRLFYRDMEQVERCAEKIAGFADKAYVRRHAHLLKERIEKVRNEAELKRAVEAIDENLKVLSKIRDFWVKEVGEHAEGKNRKIKCRVLKFFGNKKCKENTGRGNPYRNVASQLLYSPWVWHALFTLGWALLIFAALVILFQPSYLSDIGEIVSDRWMALLPFVIPIFAALEVKRRSDGRIKRKVVSEHPSLKTTASPNLDEAVPTNDLQNKKVH